QLFLITAHNNESIAVQSWEEKYPRVTGVQGKLNLDNELLLISFCDVMISMDSANMHLASLVETPVVSVWGATHPAMGFYGYNQKTDNAVQIDLECRPCSVFGNIPCRFGTYACLNDIDESLILTKVEKILADKPLAVSAEPQEEKTEAVKRDEPAAILVQEALEVKPAPAPKESKKTAKGEKHPSPKLVPANSGNETKKPRKPARKTGAKKELAQSKSAQENSEKENKEAAET
ncbi:MAG: hypothetical protein LBR34_00195, partial [Prevotella sp.]|nr:hypothetical protein [Prevotella sp.]